MAPHSRRLFPEESWIPAFTGDRLLFASVAPGSSGLSCWAGPAIGSRPPLTETTSAGRSVGCGDANGYDRVGCWRGRGRVLSGRKDPSSAMVVMMGWGIRRWCSYRPRFRPRLTGCAAGGASGCAVSPDRRALMKLRGAQLQPIGARLSGCPRANKRQGRYLGRRPLRCLPSSRVRISLYGSPDGRPPASAKRSPYPYTRWRTQLKGGWRDAW